MTGEWGFSRGGAIPAVGTAVDFFVTPEFEYPQPITISLDRRLPSASYASERTFRAEITQRNGAYSRTVLCDWRGQLTLCAQQVTVVGKVIQATVSGAGDSAAIYSALAGLGSVAKSNAQLTYGDTASELWVVDGAALPAASLMVPPMATRVLLRAIETAAGGGAPFTSIVETLIDDSDPCHFVLLRQGTTIHSEPLALTHFVTGVELGNADAIHVELNAAATTLASSYSLSFSPVFELAL